MNLFDKLFKGFRTPADANYRLDSPERQHVGGVLEALTTCSSWTAATVPSRIRTYVSNSRPEIVIRQADAGEVSLLLESTVAARGGTLAKFAAVDAAGFDDQFSGASPMAMQVGYIELPIESDGDPESGKAYTSKHECVAVLRAGKNKYQVIRWVKKVHHPAAWQVASTIIHAIMTIWAVPDI